MKKMLLLTLALSAGLMGNAMAANVLTGTSVTKAENSIVAKTPATIADRMSNVTAVKPILDDKIGQAPLSGPTTSGNLSVYYLNPVFFYMGTSTLGYTLTGNNNTDPYYYGPAYADITWTNVSTGATSYTWQYTDPSFETETPLIANTTDLTVTYPWSELGNVTLSASDGTNIADYSETSTIMLGGNYTSSDAGTFGAAMYNVYSAYSFATWDNLGLGAVGDDFWAEDYEPLGASNVKVAGFGNVYPAPAAPYAISKVWANICGVWQAGSVIDVNIYTIKNGMLNERVAQGKYTAPTAQTSAGTSWSTLITEVSVNLQTEVDGFLSEGFVTISDSIYVEFASEDPTVTSLYPAAYIPNANDYAWFQLGSNGYIDTTNKNHLLNAYNRVTFDYNGEQYEDFFRIPYFWSFSGDLQSAGYHNPMAFMIDTDATFGWLQTSAESVPVPAEGGASEEVLVSTYYEFNESVFIESDLDWDGVIDAAPWLSYEFTEPYYDESTGSNYYGSIVFTAEALPADMDGRYAQVELSATGAANVVLTVTQGAAGVNNVTAKAKANVTVEGGNFVINAPESVSSVVVYNVAGQAVASAKVAGTTTVDAASLAQGVYVLRFNDGSSVKVVK